MCLLLVSVPRIVCNVFLLVYAIPAVTRPISIFFTAEVRVLHDTIKIKSTELVVLALMIAIPATVKAIANLAVITTTEF